MDLLTTAIIAAVGKLADMAVKDGYEKLKAVIAKKLGDNNEVVVAAEKLERKPDSDGRRQTLQEEVSFKFLIWSCLVYSFIISNPLVPESKRIWTFCGFGLPICACILPNTIGTD